MRLRLNVVLTSAVVTAVGLIVLIGLLVGDDLGLLTQLVNALPFRALAEIALRLAVVAAALTLLIGVLNLLLVNVTRLLRGSTLSAKLGSLVVLATFLVTIFARLADSSGASYRLLQDGVLLPVQASLSGLVLLALVWGAMRLLARGVTWARVLFVLAVLVVLVSALPFGAPLAEAQAWLWRVPVSGGARGILIGIALATLVVGWRVLIGQDRSYGE